MIELIVSLCFIQGSQPPSVHTSCNNVAIPIVDDYQRTTMQCLVQSQFTLINWAKQHPWVDIENRAYNIALFKVNYLKCQDTRDTPSKEF